MSKSAITMGINARVGSVGTPYSAWRIGLSHNPAERQRYWQDIAKQDLACWTQWTADSLEEALAIQSYFINDKRMNGGPEVDLYANKTVFVYIF